MATPDDRTKDYSTAETPDRRKPPRPALADETAVWRDLSAPGNDDPPRAEAPGAPADDDAVAFARVLAEIGLVESSEVSPYLTRAGQAEPEALARQLIADGVLTAYQAAAVLQGKTKGLVIGPYLVLDKLGRGSMGIVFKARHRQMNRIVALKVLPPSFTRDRAALLRFRREARAVAQLNHANVVVALDAGEFNGLHFFVMEYVEGRDLARWVQDDGPLPVRRAVDYTIQAARGLREAHARGVIHRDIKPSNLLLDAGGTVKVSDLGIARIDSAAEVLGGAAAGQTELTREGTMMGTVDFMPPEQAYNAKLADHRSDIYSLGCTLHYLVTGNVPFPGETLMARVLAHREHPVPSLRADRPDVLPAIDAVFQRMLAKAPEARYPSMDAVIADLLPCLAGLPEDPAMPASPGPTRRVGPTVVARSGPTVVEPRGVSPTARPDPTVIQARGILAPTVIMDSPVASPVPGPLPGSRRVLVVASTVAVAVAVFGLAIAAVFARRLRDGSPHVGAGGRDGRVTVDRAPTSATVPSPPPATVTVAVPALPAPKALEAPVPAAPERVGIVWSIRHGEGKVEAVAVSSDGKRAVTGGIDRSVRIWELETRRELGHLAHDGPVFAVAISPDGRRAVSASGDRTVRQWDLVAWNEIGPFAGLAKKANAVAISPGGGRVLAGGDDATARLWDAESRTSLSTLHHDGRVNAVAFVPGGGLALTAGDEGLLRLWEAEVGLEVARTDAGCAVLCLAVTADGRHALAGCETGKVAVWDLDGRSMSPPRTLEGGPRDWVRAAAFSPDGLRALAGYQGGKLLVWDVESGRLVHTYDEGPEGRLGLAVLPDGLHALSADDDGAVRLWRLPDAGAR